MKKLINAPADVVADALRGMALPTRTCGSTTRTASSSAVTPRCGARSAWSPAAGPATSRCTAGSSAPACSTPPARARCSPPPSRTRWWRRPSGVDGGAGVLHIVKNYTGDVMNFEMAAELVAAEAGTEVEPVVADDDVAVTGQPLHRRPARRRRHGPASRSSPAPPPRRAARWTRSPRRPPRQRRRPQHGRGAHLLHGARRGPADVRARPRTRWRSGSASTASPAAAGSRSRRPGRSPRCWSSRSSPT